MTTMSAIMNTIARLKAQEVKQQQPRPLDHQASDMDALLNLAPLARSIAKAAEILPQFDKLEAANAELQKELMRVRTALAEASKPKVETEADEEPYVVTFDRNGEGRATRLVYQFSDRQCAYHVMRDANGRIIGMGEDPTAPPEVVVHRDRAGTAFQIEVRS